jgi:murein L,D-transpeptidase YcbB/YkuD
MDNQTGESIEHLLRYAMDHAGKIDDSIRLQLTVLTNKFYRENEFNNVWSHKENWQPLADSLLNFIDGAEMYGLFPNEYHIRHLKKLKKKIDTDSLQHMNVVLWAKADLLFTDAYLHILKDLKFGRLSTDSSYYQNDTVAVAAFFTNSLNSLFREEQLTVALKSAEPAHRGYNNLKMGIKKFVDSMDRRIYTYVTYPFKSGNVKDSLSFIKTFQKRLAESKCIDFVNKLPDSLQLNTAVIKIQKLKKIKQDGLISESLIKLINTNDAERFKRIAITLDRYKLLPATMPEKYIWVNIPGYYLQLWDHDTMVMDSKIICGKPSTPTPLLTSKISDMIIYPTWTVPNSIIVKQYLPKLKNNPYYLSRLGLKLVNRNNEDVDAGSVNWSKYSKGIPFKVIQNSGDDNALGVMKFNFNNPFAVYLHDTNQRYLFKNSSRAFSHGCVRVKEWEKLAFYISANDSINLKAGDTLRYNTDSIINWLAEKKNRRITVNNELPLFIVYFSCEGKDGKIKFYEDIYGEDKAIREKYFSTK